LVTSHRVDACSELGGSKDRYSAPGGHAGEGGVLGYEQECADFGGEVEDQVVFVVGAVVHGSGWHEGSAARGVGDLSEDLRVVVRLFLRRTDHGHEHTGGVLEDVRGKPQSKFRGVVDNAQAVGEWVAGGRRWRGPGDVRAVA
jgi:hypothetical protein